MRNSVHGLSHVALNLLRGWVPIMFPLVLFIQSAAGEWSTIAWAEFWTGSAVFGAIWLVAELCHPMTADRVQSVPPGIPMSDFRQPWHERSRPKVNCMSEPRWTWQVWRDDAG